MATIKVSLGEDLSLTTTEVEIDNLRTARKIFHEVVGKMARAAQYQRRKTKEGEE